MGFFSRLFVIGQREGLELRHLRIETLAEALLDVVDRRHLPTAEIYAEIYADRKSSSEVTSPAQVGVMTVMLQTKAATYLGEYLGVFSRR